MLGDETAKETKPRRRTGMRIYACHAILATAVFSIVFGCARTEYFEYIGTRIAAPIDIGLSPSEDYFYVLNADIDRNFNQGSILTLNQEGERISAVKTPRMGRFLNVGERALIVGFDRDSPESKPALQIFDLEDEPSPRLRASFEIDCIPIQGIQRPGYDYFAVSCSRGGLYIGKLGANLEDSEIHFVREYGNARRAMHIDPIRQILFMFPTELRNAGRDRIEDDAMQFDAETGEWLEGRNEIPDAFEVNAIQRQDLVQRRPFQFVVYNIAEEAEKNFPFATVRNADPRDREVIQSELRWLYFTLFDRDGTPDGTIKEREEIPEITSINRKYYRTNFWHAEPDYKDPNAFYLSHRTAGAKEYYNYGNSIIHVRIVGPYRNDDGSPATTASFLNFRRVYGFQGQLNADQKHFPSDFRVAPIKGVPTIVVNHFRDLDSSNRDFRYYGITSASLDGGLWHSEISSADANKSFFQLAVAKNGVGFSCSFFGNAVMRFEVEPGIAINDTITHIQ
jgi:hypothetical protein